MVLLDARPLPCSLCSAPIRARRRSSHSVVARSFWSKAEPKQPVKPSFSLSEFQPLFTLITAGIAIAAFTVMPLQQKLERIEADRKADVADRKADVVDRKAESARLEVLLKAESARIEALLNRFIDKEEGQEQARREQTAELAGQVSVLAKAACKQ